MRQPPRGRLMRPSYSAPELKARAYQELERTCFYLDPLHDQRRESSCREWPRDPRAGHQRAADQFSDDADIVGVSHEPIGSRDDERRRGTTMTRNVHAWPSARIAHHFSALASANTVAPMATAETRGAAAHHAFGQHREKRAGIGDLHDRVDVARRLDASRCPLRALVARGAQAPRSSSGRTRRPRITATITRPSRHLPRATISRRTTPGAMRARRGGGAHAGGDDTSVRSARLKRHFAANSRRRAAARRAWTPRQPCSSASSAAARRARRPERRSAGRRRSSDR